MIYFAQKYDQVAYFDPDTDRVRFLPPGERSACGTTTAVDGAATGIEGSSTPNADKHADSTGVETRAKQNGGPQSQSPTSSAATGGGLDYDGGKQKQDDARSPASSSSPPPPALPEVGTHEGGSMAGAASAGTAEERARQHSENGDAAGGARDTDDVDGSGRNRFDGGGDNRDSKKHGSCSSGATPDDNISGINEERQEEQGVGGSQEGLGQGKEEGEQGQEKHNHDQEEIERGDGEETDNDLVEWSSLTAVRVVSGPSIAELDKRRQAMKKWNSLLVPEAAAAGGSSSSPTAPTPVTAPSTSTTPTGPAGAPTTNSNASSAAVDGSGGGGGRDGSSGAKERGVVAAVSPPFSPLQSSNKQQKQTPTRAGGSAGKTVQGRGNGERASAGGRGPSPKRSGKKKKRGGAAAAAGGVARFVAALMNKSATPPPPGSGNPAEAEASVSVPVAGPSS